jgi:RNA-directed DNA polymerase
MWKKKNCDMFCDAHYVPLHKHIDYIQKIINNGSLIMLNIKKLAQTNKKIIWSLITRGKLTPNNYFVLLFKHESNAIILLSIDSPIHLLIFFETSYPKFEQIINQPSYIHYTIPKKKSGKREIYAPQGDLKRHQKRLNYYLQGYYLCSCPNEVHGFVIQPNYLGKACNILENAKPHVKKKYVLNIDLKDFFPSISAKRIKELFLSDIFNFNEQISTALTLLTTYKGQLPIGAPTSPVLSNFICLALDRDLLEFSTAQELTYTRYADDLTFSSNFLITSDHILDIINIIHEHRFNINEKKLRLQTSNQKQSVTGLTVNDKVNVDRKLLRKVRAMLHDLTTNGLDIATQRHFKLETLTGHELKGKFIHRLEGYINFIGQIRGKYDMLYMKQKQTFDEFFERKLVE